MPEVIQEFVSSAGHALRLDPHGNVLRGVKLLGLTSRNKRVYKESALREAITLYEGARVNVNHPQGDPLGPRDYRDRLGVVRNVELRPGVGLFGALHFNPRHPLAEQLVWDAEHAAENVGLSHNVLANTKREGEQVVVESIVHVQSVDLVTDPATTTGLFEHTAASATDVDPARVDWDDLTIEQIELLRPDLLVCLAESHQAELQELRASTELLDQQLLEAMHRQRALELLAEHGLQPPSPAEGEREVGRQFLQALLEVRDEETMRQLVHEQASLLRRKQLPDAHSQEQTLNGFASQRPTTDLNDFVAAVRG